MVDDFTKSEASAAIAGESRQDTRANGESSVKIAILETIEAVF